MEYIKLLSYKDKYPLCLSSNTAEVDKRIISLLLAEENKCKEMNPEHYSWQILGRQCCIRSAGIPTTNAETFLIAERLGLPSHDILLYCLNILPCRGKIALSAEELNKGMYLSCRSDLLGIWLAELTEDSCIKYAINIINASVGDVYFPDMVTNPPITTCEQFSIFYTKYKNRFRYQFYIMEDVLI